MRQFFSIKKTNIFAFVGCFLVLIFAYYLEVYQELSPCPLCIVQRVIVSLLAIILFLSLLVRSEVWISFHMVVGIVFSLFGTLLAARHVWLQYFAAEHNSGCGADFYFMLQNYPWSEFLKHLLIGGGNCGEIQWQLFGLSLPAWTLLCFIGFTILFLINFLRSRSLV